MYLSHKIRHLASICLVPLIIAMWGTISTPLVGQEKGKLEGTVLDVDKEAIPQAEVQLKDEESGEIFNFKSDKKGEFTSSSLPAGNYNITVEKEGYQSFKGELKLGPNKVRKIKVASVRMIGAAMAGRVGSAASWLSTLKTLPRSIPASRAGEVTTRAKSPF